MLETIPTPTKEELSKLKSFLEKKFQVPFTDTDVLETYYSLIHLGKALYLFNKQLEVKNGISNK